MNEIIKELLRLEKLLKNSNKGENADIEPSVQKAIDEIKEIIALLQFDDTDILDKLAYVFVSGSNVYNIAEAYGWMNELQQIETVVDAHIGYLRSWQKDIDSFDGEIKPLSTDTYAGAPGHLIISKQKWKDMKKAHNLSLLDRLLINRTRKNIQQRIYYGDTQPAVVVSLNPFIVAAYSDEMDAVVLLKFPVLLAQINNIKLYEKLISVNCYGKTEKIAKDIFVGKNYLGNWTDFRPLIGDLLSDDTERINLHKSNIPDFIWDYVRKLGNIYWREHKNLARQGFWFIYDVLGNYILY